MKKGKPIYRYRRPEDRKVECPNCDGTGKVHSHNPECWECDGSGKVTVKNAKRIVEVEEKMRKHFRVRSWMPW